MNSILDDLLIAARNDDDLRKALMASSEADDPMADFCKTATEAGFPLTVGDLFADGEEYTSNLLKSCNGGAEYPIDGWEDSYEMFLAALI